MSDDIQHIFISHIHEDDARLPALKELLAKHEYDVRDSSINSTKPNEAKNEDYIKREILAPQIDWAKALVVLISPGTHESRWVNWEIEYAHQQGKRVIGVWDRGAQDADLPETLSKYGDARVVGWHGQRIIDAINGKDEWDNVDGTPRDEADIPRHNC
ncbi:MAG TPA: TIR domain-containing protein [Candidatus Binatia bacterium]|nr:TIR domain-containing protein [Candidatus Binatia bacterium]